ncbi:hypothetical protein NL676_028915 [Syzygium grande]|nr:hypothetical protein NL676_028915 [Syzygium grande]
MAIAAGGGGGGRFLARPIDSSERSSSSSAKSSASGPSMAFRLSFHFPTHRHRSSCSLSMNGCEGDPTAPIGTVETRTFPAVATPGLAVDRLSSAIAGLKASPPGLGSGIIRLQVPIHEKIEAIDWLHSQRQLLPRCFFSGRDSVGGCSDCLLEPSSAGSGDGDGNGHLRHRTGHRLVSVAGIGSAVFFRRVRPFSYEDWLSIKRFLSTSCPLIRAYGAIRFDARSNVSPEWEAFGSFYFIVPQVEFDELEESSVLAATVAWDNALSWTWEKAINSLETTINQVSSLVMKLRKQVPKAFILSNNHVPSKNCWDLAVKRALQMINGDDSALIKVVLARSSRFLTATDIDPLAGLACLQIEGENAYQFCLQPPNAPAFIGNTPEQLFHRRWLSISSEALAGTRARGESAASDLQIELDLLSSPKDHLEFTIVRESIRRKLEASLLYFPFELLLVYDAVCSGVVVVPRKAIRKLSRVQHLHAVLAGTLRSEGDEFDILSSLHPSPAVCGFPTEEARLLIAQTGNFILKPKRCISICFRSSNL